ncbi:SRPBCC family protein [Kitasatospora sp. Ki12]
MWTFEQTGDQVTVHTEESWSGEPVDAMPEELGQALRTSLESWLTCLKNRAEKRA